MTKIRNLKPSSQVKLHGFVSLWWRKIDDNKYLDLDLNTDIGMSTSVFLPGCFIHYAIECDDAELFEDLCENGADLNKKDEAYGDIVPLQLAYDLGRANIVKKLVERGASLEGIKAVEPPMHPCQRLLTFMWRVKERFQGRQVDYDLAAVVLANDEQKAYRMKKYQ